MLTLPIPFTRPPPYIATGGIEIAVKAFAQNPAVIATVATVYT